LEKRSQRKRTKNRKKRVRTPLGMFPLRKKQKKVQGEKEEKTKKSEVKQCGAIKIRSSPKRDKNKRIWKCSSKGQVEIKRHCGRGGRKRGGVGCKVVEKA